MVSEKLHEKIVELRARQYASSLTGVKISNVRKEVEGEFERYRENIQEFCKIDSISSQSWEDSENVNTIARFLCSKISAYDRNLFIPFERPFFIEIYVENCISFLESIWKIEGTRDLTLYMVSPPAVIQLQDLEYGFAYFEFQLDK
ncbi:hypothetical protein V8J88_10835 [Massilia sp. W12]|uniref:hypothetical protein n=1 Tax=Massilia sp. W12 TaxID=3126507 RepID=UPI0030CC18CD